MLIPHTLEYPEVVQKVQDRRDDGARCCSDHCDLGSDGEFTFLLRVDVDERRDQSSYRIEKSDSVTAALVMDIFSRESFGADKSLTERSY